MDNRVERLFGRMQDIEERLSRLVFRLALDKTPMLGGNLEINKMKLHFPTSRNIEDVLDEDTMVSDSAVALATQQSIKAYVDTEVAGVTTTSNLDGGLADETFGGIGVTADGGDATSF